MTGSRLTAHCCIFIVASCSRLQLEGDAGSDTTGSPLDDIVDVREEDGCAEPDGESCPWGACSGHCSVGEAIASMRGAGTVLGIVYTEDGLAMVDTGVNCAWGCSHWTTFNMITLDGGSVTGTMLSGTISTALVWTGSEFRVFSGSETLECPASLIRVSSGGEVLSERPLISVYEWVVWTGDELAALRRTDTERWETVLIGTDGVETETSFTGALGAQGLFGLVWTGSHLVAAQAAPSSDEPARSRYLTKAFEIEGGTLSQSLIDEFGLVADGRLLVADPGVVALWIEADPGDRHYSLHARFLDDQGSPCGPSVIIDEYEVPEPPYAGPSTHPWFGGEWTGTRAVVGYARGAGEYYEIVVRTLLDTGEVGPENVVGEASYYATHSLTARDDRVAWASCHHCMDDGPYCCIAYDHLLSCEE